MENVNIFNIQKFSIHDGPGIRSVVFFKGCPLRCQWCSNPESLSTKPEIMWDISKCILCKKCENICPTKSISFPMDKFHFDNNTCNQCMSCIIQCPTKALDFYGEKMDIDKIMKEVLKDIDFYEESGGGVTLSGGEVMLHHNFALNLVKKLKEKKIHIAIETTGYAKSDVFQSLASNVDLILFDIKHYNSEKHKKYTGVNNEIILENLRWAVKNNLEIIARIPIIPSVNNSLDDAREFSKLLKEIGIKKVNLLPFHQFGEKKYENLSMEYTMKDKKALHKEDLEDYLKIFQDNDFHVKI